MAHRTRALRGRLKSANKPGLQLILVRHRQRRIILGAPREVAPDPDLLRQSVEDETPVQLDLVVEHRVTEAVWAETSIQIGSTPNHLCLPMVVLLVVGVSLRSLPQAEVGAGAGAQAL
jgi:hypothetical protein